MDKLTAGIKSARVQLNFCSEFSQTGRHQEGYRLACEVKESLETLLQESQPRASDDAIKEIRVLQCAAILAQAIDAQQLVEVADPSIPTASNLHLQANELAEQFLSEDHPMVALTKSFCNDDDGAVCASSDDARVNLPALSPAGTRRRPFKTSPSNSQSGPKLLGTLVENSRSAPDLGSDSVRSGTGGSQPRSLPSRGGREKSPPEKVSENPKAKPVQVEAKKAKMQVAGGPVHDEHHGKPPDIFKDFLAEHQRELEMNKPWFNNRQDDLRKHVNETNRFVRLQDLGKDIKELADTKYSAIGHKIQMQYHSENNECRKEKTLVDHAKKAGATCPEVFAVQQLRQALDPNAKALHGNKKKRAHH